MTKNKEVMNIEVKVTETVKEEEKKVAADPQLKNYVIIEKTYKEKESADFYSKDIISKGINAEIIKNKDEYEILCGVFSFKQNALNCKSKLEEIGYKSKIIRK